MYADALCSTLRNQLDSPLVRLPAEISNQIYGYVLTNKFNIAICTEDYCDLHPDGPVGGPLSVARMLMHAHFPRHILHLLEVCQQTYAEARLIPFGVNCVKGEAGEVNDYLSSGLLNSWQTSAVKEIHVEPLRCEICFMDGCVIGEIEKECLEDLEKLRTLQGLESLAIDFLCYQHCHQADPAFGVLAKEKIETTSQKNKSNIKIKFVDERL